MSYIDMSIFDIHLNVKWSIYLIGFYNKVN